ncbi:MAG: SoxR reducing system RseC family protein [Methylophilales bacterium]|jgi:sigma-E factor negative regulatory protein RseC|nr:SoxR reducing system RseC family protein [Methylophilales bacterium]
MIEEYAVVTACVDNQATLEIERRTACGLCGQKRGCGNATWGKLLGHKSHAFTAENAIHANVGDSVVVGINEQAMLSSVFLLYIFPMLGMLMGAVLTDIYFNNEFYVMIGATTGLLLSFVLVKRFMLGRSCTTKSYALKYQATILRQAETEDADKLETE